MRSTSVCECMRSIYINMYGVSMYNVYAICDEATVTVGKRISVKFKNQIQVTDIIR